MGSRLRYGTVGCGGGRCWVSWLSPYKQGSVIFVVGKVRLSGSVVEVCRGLVT